MEKADPVKTPVAQTAGEARSRQAARAGFERREASTAAFTARWNLRKLATAERPYRLSREQELRPCPCCSTAGARLHEAREASQPRRLFDVA
ncbi:hypothetical protein [Kitasatospora sp. NPDC097691]|uniref:hypothetical protein n=1 Tax=Kitasatospora sp. NPDC097691 TaxID=3157231 RepID=UPI00332C647C